MFKKSEYNKLLKVKGILEEIWDGKLSKYHLTVAQSYEIAKAYNQIIKGNAVETISNEVKQFFEKHNLCVKENGIGWIITLE